MKHMPLAIAVIVALASHSIAEESDFAPSFRRDVMPVFFRAGCNAGTCHGAARGKDGYMLSLFGYDPAGDYRRTVEELPGRRVNTAVPHESLLLLKATAAVPHTGGKLFDCNSDLYRTLLAWISAGAPDDSGSVPEVTGISLPKPSVVFTKIGQQGVARVKAAYSDGSTRDVTALARFFSNNTAVADVDADGRVTAKGPGDTNIFARFSRFTVGAETIVLPAAEGFTWPNPPINNFIDELVFDRLEKLQIIPSDLCDDETFLRRVTIDLVARPPTVEEYDAFMRDPSNDKRSKKIDALLATDEFADYQAALWAEQLRIIGGNYSPFGTVVKAADAFAEWIREQFRENRPLDKFVSDMVTASGSNIANGPANLYTMLVHKPRPDPKALAADFSQLFLGVQIQCAECHNHPFDRWTMSDYYGLVSFFSGVQWKPGVEPRDKRIYWNALAAPVVNPLEGRPQPPKVLGSTEAVLTEGDPRPALAAWLTSRDNKLFAGNLANRVWAHFFGRGVVEPVDDIRVSNPPANAPLLDALAGRLVELKFDLRGYVRDICNSRVYQLSVTPTPSNARDIRHFSHARLRRLRADVLLDSVVAVTNAPRALPNWPAGTRAVAFYPKSPGGTQERQTGDPFFTTFGRSPRGSICVCETKNEPTLSQAMHLNAGDTLRDRLAAGGVVRSLVETQASPEDVIRGLFIRTLCRQPMPEEMSAIADVVTAAEDRQAAFEDVFWALLNSTEFLFNR